MTTDDVATISRIALEGLPEEIQDQLADVTIVAVDSHTDEACAGHQLPADFRGVFIGAQARASDDADTADLTVEDAVDEDDAESLLTGESQAEGTIFLNAAMLRTHDDVVDTLAHEVGHALGLSEDEVEELGL